jgi:catalase
MDDLARGQMVSNVVGHLLDGVTEPVLERDFQYRRSADPQLGDQVEKAPAAVNP